STDERRRNRLCVDGDHISENIVHLDTTTFEDLESLRPQAKWARPGSFAGEADRPAPYGPHSGWSASAVSQQPGAETAGGSGSSAIRAVARDDATSSAPMATTDIANSTAKNALMPLRRAPGAERIQAPQDTSRVVTGWCIPRQPVQPASY